MKTRTLVGGLTVWLACTHLSYASFSPVRDGSQRVLLTAALSVLLGGLVALLWQSTDRAQPEFAHVQRGLGSFRAYWPAAGISLLALMPATIAYACYHVDAVREAVDRRALVFPLELHLQLARGEFAGMVKLLTWAVPLVVVFPIMEEILYRGFLLGWCKARMSRAKAWLVVTAVFVVQHDVFGAGYPPPLWRMVQHAIAGCLFIYLTEWRQSIRPAAMVHIALNLSAWLIGMRPHWP